MADSIIEVLAELNNLHSHFTEKNSKMKNYFLLLISIFFAISLHAQDSPVIDAELPESEFHVAINPTDTNHIILATMHGKGETNDLRSTIHLTREPPGKPVHLMVYTPVIREQVILCLISMSREMPTWSI
jgi:hypothetical protein